MLNVLEILSQILNLNLKSYSNFNICFSKLWKLYDSKDQESGYIPEDIGQIKGLKDKHALFDIHAKWRENEMYCIDIQTPPPFSILVPYYNVETEGIINSGVYTVFGVTGPFTILKSPHTVNKTLYGPSPPPKGSSKEGNETMKQNFVPLGNVNILSDINYLQRFHYG
ncbi:hypothetical protein C2G38_2186078 [Gigaspora rosea]|uniref:Uncharacterized protein n=1 Tax=Gigaspora rosea TaxID=44941 RepID=A0A397V636_9GLOM|nr:hypothetical protein C2G38_2186078 [Gigaspora rosea]